MPQLSLISGIKAAQCRMASRIVLWTERHLVSLLAWYILGRKNVLADQLSRPAQVGSVEGSLDWHVIGFGGSFVAPEGVVHQPSVLAGRRIP